ncbi:MAG: protein kinase [Planctomycetes bacterium]|nr:protein kinase [Planctomycetota bacterium]
MARLKVLKGADVGAALALPVYPSVLGRDEGCDLVVDDPRASRQHACFRFFDDAWQVRDLETSNGTFVNDRKVAGWTALRTGARVRVGRTELVFEDDAQVPLPAERSSVGAAGQVAPTPPDIPRDVANPVSRVPVIPGHEVFEPVGKGATGIVYRGRQSNLGRAVAIKVLDPSLARAADYVERFVREAQAAAALSHPHVVPVYDVGEHGGVHYFTMEFMEGGTVEDLLLAAPGSRLAWREAVRIAGAAAAGVAYLHAQGFVHRDIKPANLLLDARRDVKLGDMGTVVRADDHAAQRIGTPHFMSPEQAGRRPVTRASDVYSLGATLYRMLSGATPHHGRDQREILADVESGTPPPIERLCPGLPDEVVQVVHEMMARDPSARPVDAGDVGRRLEAALLDIRTSRDESRRSRRFRSEVSSWVTPLLILAVIGGVLWWYRDRVELAVKSFSRERPSDSAVRDVPTPTAPATPAQLAAATFAEIRDREKALDPPTRGNVATTGSSWRAIADDYARLAEVFPLDDEWVVRGHWRSRAIYADLADAGGGDAQNAAFADRWVARALRDVGGIDGTGPSGQVVPPDTAPDGRPSDSPSDAASLTALRATRDALLARADAMVDGGRVQTALDLVLAWVREQRLLANQRLAPSAVHETIAGGVQWMRATTRRVSARLENEVGRDRVLLRAHLPASSCFSAATAPAAGALDFDNAIARLDALKPLLLTYLGADRLDARRARLVAERTAWDAVSTVVRVVPPSPVTSPANSAAWRDAVAAAITAALDRVPREHRGPAIHILLDAGRIDVAQAALVTHAELDADTVSTLRAEIAAARARAALGATPDATTLSAFLALHSATDASLLRGPSARVDRTADAHPVFTQDETDHFYETWGGVPPDNAGARSRPK